METSDTQQDYTGTVKTQILLGDLELTLNDLLALRPGSMIDFGAEPELKGTLQLGQSEIGRVSLRFVDGRFIAHFSNFAEDGKQDDKKDETSL